MDHKKSPTSRRTKRQSKALEENYWDCSVCTYRNTAEAFKCLMCDIRKGTSTRKPRINPQLVAQQVAQQFNPTPAKTHKREKSDKKSSNDRRSSKKKHHLRKLKNVDRNSAETREVTVNNVTVMITEYKPKPAKKLVSDQSGQSSRASSESESSSEAPSAAADSDSRSSLLKLKIEQKLSRTTNRIQKARQNAKIAQKEAAEFEEIHKILESREDNLSPIPESKPLSEVQNTKFLVKSVIPLTPPGINVFNSKSTFSLFDKDSLQLKNFIDSKEFPNIFGKNDSIPSEEGFRNLIAYRVAENLMPDGETSTSINLYVLYLMSVHNEAAFVTSCLDFLILRPFRIEPKHIFPVLINFGANLDDCCCVCEEGLLRKLSGNNGDFRKASEETKFPFFNIEMVGKILLHYVTGNFIAVNSDTKSLVKALARITLDPKVRSGSLLPLYSILLSAICSRIHDESEAIEIVDWLHFRDEHLLNQLEICRIVSKAVCPDLHDVLLLKTIRSIFKSKTFPRKTQSKIECVKSVLKRLKSKELSPLEFYCLFQLINSSLPGVTATVEDSLEINKILTGLESKIIQTEDSVDLIRLKLEIAKARNLVANNVNNRFTLEEALIASPVSKAKCSK